MMPLQALMKEETLERAGVEQIFERIKRKLQRKRTGRAAYKSFYMKYANVNLNGVITC